MALPTYASPLEKVWHYAYLVLCAAIFFFLIAPIVVVIPLSFNAEPYFTFTDKMLSFDPEGYSMRWYNSLLTFGMTNPDAPGGWGWWADAWQNAKWIKAAKSSIIIGFFSTILATVLGTLAALGLSRPEMPFRRIIMAVLISRSGYFTVTTRYDRAAITDEALFAQCLLDGFDEVLALGGDGRAEPVTFAATVPPQAENASSNGSAAQ